jgi:alkanesulfonate monooxygenase SsuD/methylene tetrahydromethanopterin reductase-like flavin-dependent oxidoreductase (luciferase family)
MVLPYRNPFLVAKAISTLDHLSQGRAILTAGVGNLKSEFAAVGVNFEERQELFDEAIDVMRGAWTHRVSLRGPALHEHGTDGTAVPCPRGRRSGVDRRGRPAGIHASGQQSDRAGLRC